MKGRYGGFLLPDLFIAAKTLLAAKKITVQSRIRTGLKDSALYFIAPGAGRNYS
jgi:hypothetical protein